MNYYGISHLAIYWVILCWHGAILYLNKQNKQNQNIKKIQEYFFKGLRYLKEVTKPAY